MGELVKKRTYPDMVTDMRRAFSKLLNSKDFEEFTERYEDWQHAKRVVRSFEEIMDMILSESDGTEVLQAAVEQMPRRSAFEKLNRIHRMTENIVLDVGEYMGLWGPVECGVCCRGH